MINKSYQLHYGNFFNCSLSETNRLKRLLQLRKQPSITNKNAKKYLDNLFNAPQMKKGFSYYLLWPTESDIYVDITKKSLVKKALIRKWDKRENEENNIPEFLLKKWQDYERKKSRYCQEDRNITYDKGYYLHSGPILKKYDEFFRQHVSEYTSQLIEVLLTNPRKNQRIISAYLLGWSKKTVKVQKTLEQTFDADPEHEVHNAAGRSLFPILLKKKKIEIEPYLGLLNHQHTLCRNKACGILAFAPSTEQQRKYIIQKALNTLVEMFNS